MNQTKLIFPKYLADLHPRPGATTTGIPTPLCHGRWIVEFNNIRGWIEDSRFNFPHAYLGPFQGTWFQRRKFERCHTLARG